MWGRDNPCHPPTPWGPPEVANRSPFPAWDAQGGGLGGESGGEGGQPRPFAPIGSKFGGAALIGPPGSHPPKFPSALRSAATAGAAAASAAPGAAAAGSPGAPERPCGLCGRCASPGWPLPSAASRRISAAGGGGKLRDAWGRAHPDPNPRSDPDLSPDSKPGAGGEESPEHLLRLSPRISPCLSFLARTDAPKSCPQPGGAPSCLSTSPPHSPVRSSILLSTRCPLSLQPRDWLVGMAAGALKLSLRPQKLSPGPFPTPERRRTREQRAGARQEGLRRGHGAAQPPAHRPGQSGRPRSPPTLKAAPLPPARCVAAPAPGTAKRSVGNVRTRIPQEQGAR